jgi:hypothetical protein
MIYVILAILYIAFAWYFALGRQKTGATIGSALAGGWSWPFSSHGPGSFPHQNGNEESPSSSRILCDVR